MAATRRLITADTTATDMRRPTMAVRDTIVPTVPTTAVGDRRSRYRPASTLTRLKKAAPEGAAFELREEGQLTPLRLPFPAPDPNPGPWHRHRGRRTRSRPSARCHRSGSRP